MAPHHYEKRMANHCSNKILDNINNFSNDRFGNFKIKIMDGVINLLQNKNFLIYGFGKSGKACFNFLNKKNFCKIFDDNQKNITKKYKKNIINYIKLENFFFDFIVLSPGIDIKNVKFLDI